MRTGLFRLIDLLLVAPAPAEDSPPLSIGDSCRLNSGGPAFLVVEADAETVIVAKDGASDEIIFPRACVRRVRKC